MHRRKNIGIIKYGSRLTKNKPVQKLQTGGSASVVSGYEWREDPYELMLMKQESQGYGRGSKGRSSSRSKSPSLAKDPKLGNFDILEGGFKGTRDALNSSYKALQQQYANDVLSNPPAWVSSIESQQAYQKVVTTGQEYQEILKREQKQFEDAKGKLNKDDPDTLAMSDNNNMMVRDKKTGQYAFLGLGSYLDNMSTYDPVKLKDFMNWKENTDQSGAGGSTQLINEFMVNNAISPEAVNKNYVVPKLPVIKYIKENGLIVPNGDEKFDKSMAKARVETWAETIRAGMSNTKPQGVTENAAQDIMRSLKVVYDGVLDGTEDASRLKVSLYAEVLKNLTHRDAMEALGTKEEKFRYLEKQARLALVNKIYVKGTSEDKSSSGESGGNKGKSNPIMAGMYNLADGNEVSGYIVGSDFMTGEDKKDRRVIDIITPKVNGVGKAGDMGLVKEAEALSKREDNPNTITGNPFLRSTSDTSEIYLENGLRFNTEFGSDASTKFVESSMRMAPGTDADMVYIFMDGEDNMTMHEGDKIVNQKLNNRKAFLKIHNEMAKSYSDMEHLDVDPNNMLPGATGANGEAYTLFQNWADTSTKYKELNKYAKANPNDKQAARRRGMSYAAVKMREQSEETLASLNTKQLKQMIKVTVLVDADGAIDIRKIGEKYAKDRNYGQGMIKDADSGDKSFMDNTNDIDHWNILKNWSSDGFWRIDDNVYRMNILLPVDSQISTATRDGEQVVRLQEYKAVQDAANSMVNMESAITNPGNADALSNFIRE
jgi:hypothetical protein